MTLSSFEWRLLDVRLLCVSGSDVVVLNSLLGDRLVVSKTDDLLKSYEESVSAVNSEGLLLCVS